MPYQGVTFTGSASGEILQSTFKRQSLQPTEVLIRITHSGLCGTDLHALNNGCVLGHEGVGVVEEVGPAVTRFKVGERAGWGYLHATCGQCRECLTGKEEYCATRSQFMVHNLDQGSLGEIAIFKQDWLFKVPDGLKSEYAAPLMCGGATVFAPLIRDVKPTDRVGIIGVGGLGHLAVQFASKMGCDIVVFSGSDSKREEALKLGAHEFYATKGVEDFKTLGLPKPIDRLIVTTATLPDFAKYYEILSVNATIIPITFDPNGIFQIPYIPTLLNGNRVVGTILAGRSVHTDMLEFAARNKVFPIIETFPLTQEGITTAVKKLQEGKMRYRGVLVKDL